MCFTSWCLVAEDLPAGRSGETRRYDARRMPTVSEILAALDRVVPEGSAAAWDPSGLQLGDPSAAVDTVAVCHEVTDAVLDRIEAEHPGLVVTYHPLLFKPTTSLISGRSPTGRAWRLARAGISLAVAHTSFDSAGGTGEALAAALGLSNVRVFGPTGPAASAKVVTFLPWESVEPVTEAMAEAGGGRIGNYTGCSFRVEGVGAFEASTDPYAGTRGENRVQEYRVEMIVPRHRVGPVTAALVTAHPYEEPAYDIYEVTSNGRFIGRVGQFEGSFDELVAVTSEVTGSDGMRVARASDRASTVAVVPGSGSSFISAARSAGADVFVTGDVDHHRVVEARDGGMSIIDPGHAPTERPGMAALVDAVRTAVPEVGVVDLTGFDPTPWR
jgi:dinuclear metal center YbgI/SA1388 family protein